MNLGQLSRLGFIERKMDLIMEGPLLDLLMDTDALKDRIINGALSDIFHIPMPRTPAVIEAERIAAAEAAEIELEKQAESDKADHQSDAVTVPESVSHVDSDADSNTDATSTTDNNTEKE